MTLVVFVVTFVVAGGILVMVLALARGERASWFKGVSPAILSPLGVIFGLMVVFIAAQVWSDIDRAQAAVDRPRTGEAESNAQRASGLADGLVLAAAQPKAK